MIKKVAKIYEICLVSKLCENLLTKIRSQLLIANQKHVNNGVSLTVTSSHPKVFCQKVVLEKLAKFIRQKPAPVTESLFNLFNLQTYVFCIVFQKKCFKKHLLEAASNYDVLNLYYHHCVLSSQRNKATERHQLHNG